MPLIYFSQNGFILEDASPHGGNLGVQIVPLLGACAYLSHNHGPFLKQQMDAHKSFPEFERLEAALTSIGGADLVNQVASTEQEFVVPSDDVGFILDLSQQNKAASDLPSYALVTTPSGEDEKVFIYMFLIDVNRSFY